MLEQPSVFLQQSPAAVKAPSPLRPEALPCVPSHTHTFICCYPHCLLVWHAPVPSPCTPSRLRNLCYSQWVNRQAYRIHVVVAGLGIRVLSVVSAAPHGLG